MWSKGAVVVVKHGDPGIANELEKIFRNNNKSTSSGGYCFLPRRHTTEELKAMIEDAERQYGQRRIPPKWLECIRMGLAFVVYHICIFIEKYLVL